MKTYASGEVPRVGDSVKWAKDGCAVFDVNFLKEGKVSITSPVDEWAGQRLLDPQYLSLVERLPVDAVRENTRPHLRLVQEVENET